MNTKPNNEENELENTLQKLWKNPLFRLSLSSNELFHSNILQYLAEDGNSKTPKEISANSAKKLFHALTGKKLDAKEDTYTIEREWHHMDLS